MTFWLILLFICHTVNRPYVFCLQLVTKIFKDDIELETYITSAHYGVCSEVRYVLFFFLFELIRRQIHPWFLVAFKHFFVHKSGESLSVW